MRWSRNTVVKVAAPVLFHVLFAASHAMGSEGSTAGTASGKAVLQRFGSKSSLNQNISRPMTHSDTPMTTLNGGSSFTSASGVPSSAQFLSLLIQPSGTGDLSQVIIAQDLDADGTVDHGLDLGLRGIPVSGVCANGFISCTPGTWTSCQPYKWVSDAQGGLDVSEVELSELGGCYCINSSCGSSLVWSNSATVLKDLGGGAVGAIHAQDATVQITDVRTNMTDIAYYGQLLKQAKTADSKVPELASVPSAPAAQAYFKNSAQLNSDTSMVSVVNSGNTDSMYYKLVNSAAAQTSMEQAKCTVRREGQVVSAAGQSFTDSGSSQMCVDNDLYMIIKGVGNQKYELKLLDRKFGDWHKNCGTWESQHGHTPDPDGWHLQHTVTLPAETGSSQTSLVKSIFNISNVQCGACQNGGPCQVCSDGSACLAVGTCNDGTGCKVGGAACADGSSCSDSFVGTTCSNGTACTPGVANTCTDGGWCSIDPVSSASIYGLNAEVHVGAPCTAPGAQYPTFDWSYLFEFATDSYQESIKDDCAALANTCTKVEETVDGVETVRKGKDTGLRPLGSSKTFAAVGPAMEIFRPWWRKDRTYLCPSKQPMDFTALQQRYDAVAGSITDSESELKFTDKQKDADGNWVAKDVVIGKPGSAAHSTCESSCKVRHPIVDTQVAQTVMNAPVVASSSRATTESFEDLYRTCVDDNTTCPVETGDVILEECKCANNFSQAAAVMQMLRLGGADSICSSGTPVPP